MLYEVITEVAAEIDRWIHETSGCVITSYSIHYTKLYDPGHGTAGRALTWHGRPGNGNTMRKLHTFGLHQGPVAAMLAERLQREGIACVVRNAALGTRNNFV